jgi:hypothetical protein
MAKKKNPHCPVPGCQTRKPHADDRIVKALIETFGTPEKMTHWTLAAMVDLRDSIIRDIQDKKIFAWFTRLRQVEELYIRTLYNLFVANEKQLHHSLSGEMPNSYALFYEDVNRVVFGERGRLLADQPDLIAGTTFKAKDVLNDGAHASYSAFLTCIGLVRNPEHQPKPGLYEGHIQKYCTYLNYMHEMFQAGKDKKDVLSGVINLHRPASYWGKR